MFLVLKLQKSYGRCKCGFKTILRTELQSPPFYIVTSTQHCSDVSELGLDLQSEPHILKTSTLDQRLPDSFGAFFISISHLFFLSLYALSTCFQLTVISAFSADLYCPYNLSIGTHLCHQHTKFSIYFMHCFLVQMLITKQLKEVFCSCGSFIRESKLGNCTVKSY